MPPQEFAWTTNRLLAQPFLQSLAKEEISGAEGLRRLREAGVGYRESVFYHDWRQERGLVRYEYECTRLSSDTVPPTRVFTQTDWPGLTSKYLYEFRLTTFNTEKEEYEEVEYRAIGTDTLLTVGEAEDEYWSRFNEGVSDPDLIVTQASLIAVRRRTW